MSVHNTAAGLCSIQGKAAIPMTSLAAGENGLMAGLTEAVCALQAGARRVLLVAFEGPVPEFHRPWLAEPHARPLPQSLACWRALLRHESTLTLCDGRQEWAWQRC